MKNVRLLVLTVVLVAVLGLSACTVALPGAAAGLGALSQGLSGLMSRQQTAAQPASPANVVLQTTPPPVNVGDLQAALEKVYEASDASVVSIRVMTTGSMSALQQLPNMPNIPGLPFGQSPDQGQSTPQAVGEGSGFVWDKQGNIVTNNHVVDGATDITVTFADGTSVPAQVVGRDPESDLAVIKIDSDKVALQPVTVADSTQVKPGQFVVAIGNPFGLANSMTFGIISALGRSLPVSSETSAMSLTPTYTIPDLIQTDAPVNPGNSGGVLLDLAGSLVGVPTAIESPVRGSAGVGYAIPSAIVQQVVPELIAQGRFEHPYIGISGGTLVSKLAKAMGLPETQRGALVAMVASGSPAEKAGLQGSAKQVDIDGEQVKVGGDVITAINGQPVKDFEDLVTYLARSGKVGQEVKLTVLRNSSETTVSLTLAARPSTRTQSTTENAPSQGAPSAPQTAPRTAGGAWLGISGLTLSSDVAQAMKLSADQTGALVEEVTSGSPAEKAGLQGSTEAFTTNGQQINIGGDVITAVDGQAVTSMEELASTIQARQPGDQVALTVLRNGKEIKVDVTLGTRPASLGAQTPRNRQQPQQQPQQQQQPQATGGAWLGISGVSVTPEIASAMNLKSDQTGALVAEVVTGSPAEKFGLQTGSQSLDLNGQQVAVGGDVITAVDGKSVTTMQDLSAAIKAKQPGDKVELTVLRNGKEITVTVTLGARPAQSN